MANSIDSAQVIQACYQALEARRSNLILEVLGQSAECISQKHYPAQDVRDKQHHSQYYYHSHASQDPDRLIEHGHFHIFLREPALSPQATILARSEKYLESQGKKDNLCHLFAISMNSFGQPLALFTTNFWVTKGLWYPAPDIIAALDQFNIDLPNSPYAITNQWITHMTRLFTPFIHELLLTRDQVVANWALEHPEEDVFSDRRLEVTSVLNMAV